MKDNEFRVSVRERINRGLNKDCLINILMLIVPTLLLMAIAMLSLYSFILSLFAIYFVLPMFYTTERRIRFSLTGIGKRDFSFADGYKAFFQERKGGIFGVIISLCLAFGLFLVSYLIIMNFFPNICNCFGSSMDVYSEFIKLYQDPYSKTNDVVNFLKENLYALNQPLTISLGLCLFLPIFSILFFYVPENLSNHYLATIVLPDIDKNISASQARTLSKNGFGRPIFWKRQGYRFKYSWYLMLGFVALYGASLYLCSTIQVTNSLLVPLIILITPTCSLFYGLICSYFVVLHDYAVVEELSKTLLSLLPEAMKISIYQAFTNPHYVHGDESSARGSFIPTPNSQEQPHIIIDAEVKESEEPSVASAVVDFSDDNEGEDKK